MYALGDEKRKWNLDENTGRKKLLEDLGIDGRTVLKQILKKYVCRGCGLDSLVKDRLMKAP
jgi:hypothetical protein